MRTVLLDTQTRVWSLFRAAELSNAARQAIEQATAVYVPPRAIHEITAKRRSE